MSILGDRMFMCLAAAMGGMTMTLPGADLPAAAPVAFTGAVTDFREDNIDEKL